ncbi:MAG: hypothetical protein ABI488_13670 [Polyangiaceae bacterium]
MFEFRAQSLRIAVLAGVISALGTARVAHANTNLCMPPPATVPGLSGAPEWEDFNADAFWRPELDDPRWAGSPLRYLDALPIGGQPAWASQVTMRALTVGRFLYVSIRAESDDNGPTFQDSVYVAFSQGSAAGAYALGIDMGSPGTLINPPPNPTVGVVVPADNPLPRELVPATITYYQSTNAQTDPLHPATEPIWGGENDGAPSWLKGARWDRPVAGGPRWAMTLRIDLSPTGLNIGGHMNIFFGAKVHTSTGDVIVGNATPKVGADADALDVTPIPKRADLWPLYDNLGTVCSGDVTVDPSDIGVWTGAPGVGIGGVLTDQICTGSACTTPENTFRVIVRNVPNGGGISPWDVRVRLRLAGWDSEAAHQVEAPWPDITGTPTGTQITTKHPGDFTSDDGWYWGTPVDAGDGTSSVAVDYKCTKGNSPFCPQLADMSNPHQALSVELSVPSGIWAISKAATYRAMDFTVPAGGSGSGGAGGGGAGGGGSGSGGTGGALGAGGSVGGTSGVPSGGASNAEAGASGESEAGDTASGGSQSIAGAPNGASGSSTAVMSAAGNAGTAATVPASSNTGGSCGFRALGRNSSSLADLAALVALGVALRRKRRRTAKAGA